MYKEAPKGWQFVPADKYCAEVTDGTHDSPKPIEYSGHYLLTSKNITSGILNYENAYCISEEDFNAVNKRSKVNQYDLLYSMIGTVGESCIVDKEIIDFAIKNVGLFRLNGDLLKAKWLNYFFKSNIAKTYVEKSLKGATQKYIALGVLRKFPILIPSTTAEQQEIVHVLDTMSDIIRLREECISHAQDLIPALFQEMFDNPQTNKKNWQICCLKDLAKIDRQNISPEELKTKQYPYIGLEHIEKETGRILVDPHSQQDIDLKSNKFFFKNNHVLYGKLRPYLNKVALPDFDGVCSTDIFPLLPLDGISNKYFLKALMSTSYFVNMANSQSSGANLPRIVTTALENIKVFKPDYTLQEQFAQKVIEIEAYIKEQQEELANAKQMFQSLLHHAFTGELTKHKYGEINE